MQSDFLASDKPVSSLNGPVVGVRGGGMFHKILEMLTLTSSFLSVFIYLFIYLFIHLFIYIFSNPSKPLALFFVFRDSAARRTHERARKSAAAWIRKANACASSFQSSAHNLRKGLLQRLEKCDPMNVLRST